MANLIEFDLDEVERLASQGLTQEQIADALGVSARTVGHRIVDSSEFAAAIKRGKAKGIDHVTNKLREMIDAGNVTAGIFYLKCRAGWKDTQSVELSGAVKIDRVENVIVDPPKQ